MGWQRCCFCSQPSHHEAPALLLLLLLWLRLLHQHAATNVSVSGSDRPLPFSLITFLSPYSTFLPGSNTAEASVTHPPPPPPASPHILLRLVAFLHRLSGQGGGVVVARVFSEVWSAPDGADRRDSGKGQIKVNERNRRFVEERRRVSRHPGVFPPKHAARNILQPSVSPWSNGSF